MAVDSTLNPPPPYDGSIIPNAPALEETSSAQIAALLNPPALFTDVSRQAAEVGTGRGLAGSAAAWGGGLRMTDEERLRRIALGEQLMTGAYGRNLPLIVTPWQQEQVRQADLDRDLRERLGLRATEDRGGGGGRLLSAGAPAGVQPQLGGLVNYPWTDLGATPPPGDTYGMGGGWSTPAPSEGFTGSPYGWSLPSPGYLPLTPTAPETPWWTAPVEFEDVFRPMWEAPETPQEGPSDEESSYYYYGPGF